MAAIAHLGVGLASKRVLPRVPLWALLIATWAIDLVWGLFFFAGLEKFPGKGVVSSAPYSHGLLMACVWSVLAAVIAILAARDRRTGTLIGLLVFSHWIVDFISKPMLAAFPTDSGLPLLFAGSPTVGLGMYGTQLGQTIGEYGSLIVGVAVYALTIRRLRQDRRAATAGSAIAGEGLS